MIQSLLMYLSKKYLVLILITVILMGVLQFSHGKLFQDDYYHIRYSQMLREHGLYREFPWLKYTVFNKRFYDLHFLYHVLLIPFTFGNLIIAGKIAGIFFACISSILLFFILNRYRIEYPIFWSLLFILGSTFFLPRLLSTRPISVSIIFLIMGTYLLFERKYIWVSVLSYLFVLTYSAFPIFIVVVVVYTVTYLFYYKKLELRPLLFCLMGVAAGLLINPYFPANLKILYIDIIKTTLFRSGLEPNLEWLPLSSWSLLTSSWGIFLIFSTVILLLLTKKERQHSFMTVFLFVQSMAFLFGYLKYTRGIDQFVPYAVLFCAFAFSDLKIELTKALKIGMLIIVLLFIGNYSYLAVKNFRSRPILDSSGSAEWLRENTPEGSEVFIANYGAFAELFFYNQHNVYTLGLDSMYMKEYDERLHNLYQDAIWLRRDPYPIIKREFGAPYIHVENVSRSINFYRYLRSRADQYSLVYKDDFSAIFEVK